MARLRCLTLCGLLLALPPGALAGRPLVYTGEPLTVRLAPRQPTAVTFPEPIAAVPTGADPHQLSLELDGPRLFLQPLDPAVSGLLFAIGVSGRSYALRFAVGTPADTEVVVTLPPPSAPVAPGQPTRAGVPWRRLLRAMLQGTPLPGMTEAPLTQDLGTMDSLRLTLVRVYTAGTLRGYVVEATNPTDTVQPVPVQTVTVPGLRALTAETDTVPARGTTRLYLVVQGTTP
jgi:hypothetical protein